MVYLFYTTYISVDLAHHKIFPAQVSKGGIKLPFNSNDRILTKLQWFLSTVISCRKYNL